MELLTIPNDHGRKMRCPPENPGKTKTTFIFIFLSKFPKYRNYSIFWIGAGVQGRQGTTEQGNFSLHKLS